MRNIRLTQWRSRLGFILAVLLLSSSVVMANQGSDLSWHTADGGGGVSSGGRFAVSGTAGQPEAQIPLYGAGYTLQGGFWSGRISAANELQAVFLPLIIKAD